MPQLKAAHLQHDPIVGRDLVELFEQAAADVAAEPRRRPAASRIAAVMAAVVDLPFEPVTPTIRAGQASMNSSISRA